MTLRALFLSHEHSLSSGGGGQQQCTREYHDALRLAGFELADETFATDRAWSTRLRRKLRPRAYSDLFPETFPEQIAAAVRRLAPTFVFCNLHNFVPFSHRLRPLLPNGTKLVLLSHGLASVDELHAARIAAARAGPAAMSASAERRLGAMLGVEGLGLPLFDHVFCLAAFEVEICRWLGTRSVSWIPRTVDRNSHLAWHPTGDRVGCVGTLDHPPNLEGIERYCAALQVAGPGRLRLRLITRSRAVAADLGSRYSFVDDLGPMEAAEAVESEVSTWNAFVHPIFCLAMGCSTKVATALAWGLPVLTTTEGLRGYQWRDGALRVAVSAADLAARSLEVLARERAEELREEVLRIVASSPTLEEVAAQIRRDLGIG